jgi:hypothetical protein
MRPYFTLLLLCFLSVSSIEPGNIPVDLISAKELVTRSVVSPNGSSAAASSIIKQVIDCRMKQRWRYVNKSR